MVLKALAPKLKAASESSQFYIMDYIDSSSHVEPSLTLFLPLSPHENFHVVLLVMHIGTLYGCDVVMHMCD